MNRILVTGGAGFLGSNLCKTLLEKGHEVICLDNLISGRMRNIEPLLMHPRFVFLQHDVRNPVSAEVDRIYNLACPASPPVYQSDPVGTTLTSVLGAQNLLDLAAKSGARILQASTSEVYGDPDISPQPEQYRGNVNPIGIRSCYDEGKRCAESLFFDYHRKYGVEIKIARIFNTYGPGMAADDGRVISNFINQALVDKPITIYGDGSQTRSFCYVDCLIEGLIALMESTEPVAGPVNLGNPEEFTIKELASLIVAKLESRSEIVNLKLPEDDPLQRCPDISRAITMLNWRPRIALNEGLQKTIEYFREVGNA